MTALTIGMPPVHRLGFCGTGFKLVGPTFLKLGRPVLLLDRAFLPDAEELGFAPFASHLPGGHATVHLERHGSDVHVVAPVQDLRARLRLSEASLPSPHVWMIVCDSALVELSWGYLWYGLLGRVQLSVSKTCASSPSQHVAS